MIGGIILKTRDLRLCCNCMLTPRELVGTSHGLGLISQARSKEQDLVSFVSQTLHHEKNQKGLVTRAYTFDVFAHDSMGNQSTLILHQTLPIFHGGCGSRD